MASPTRLFCTLSRVSSFARTSIQLQRARHKTWSASETPLITQYPTASDVGPEWRYPLRLTRKRSIQTASDKAGRSFTSIASPANPKTSQPEYKAPTTGLLSRLPSSWIPYAELIRLDKPTGTYYLFFPCLFSTLLAAPLAVPVTPPFTVLSTTCLFFAGALIMRGAGCTINDLWDRNLDPHVARTRLRPIARGAISVREAIPFLGAQLLAGLGVLACFPTQCLYYGIPSLALVATYPLAKRVTNYPQLVLGLTFSWGAIMGFPAVGVDLISDTFAMVSAGCLYASCVAWTVVYDMIYAYQDIRDDAAAGIKSIALAQESNAKTFLGAVAGAQVAMLVSAGLAVGAGPVFFVGSCGGAAGTLGYMIWDVDLRSVADCWRWFRRSAWVTGGLISLGLLTEYVMRYLDQEEGDILSLN